ncbi:MAG: M23 family metallopeptidase [Bacteroidales bacterium]|nr:M23 family metallopeptidase [Bacteroidales bacterium]
MKIDYKRMKAILISIMIVMILFPCHLDAQHDYPEDYFRSPVDFRILLSGTFGELRAGHFHSGMDIKTGGVSGKNIYAVADGYVSRIKVSATGFGKTLYVTHPNGYVSVYAHLSRFNERIGPYVKQKHYEHESFELNLFPEKGSIPVKKGKLIAYSGNTGGSNGPHLHFEMRREGTQTPVNPLLFGYKVKDYIRPEIHWLKVYPSRPGAYIDGHANAKVFQVDGWGEQHRVKDHDTISISGPFSLAINAYDKLNDANNNNGVYSVKLYADEKLFYSHELEKFDFIEARYINSFIDYEEYKENKRRYQRTEIDPNNKLSIYGDVMNEGILYFDDADIHHLEYVITDFEGNVSRLPIVIRSVHFTDTAGSRPPEGAVFFSILEENEFTAENFELSLPGSCLYRDMWFEYDSASMPEGSFSRIHRIHNDRTPVHKYFNVEVVPDTIPIQTDKLILARITDDGDYISYGGKWEDGMLKASIRSFGDYMILIDTIPPEITSVNISSGQIKPDRKTVKLKIKDELSGIRRFRASLNGSWVLMDYDAKNALLTYTIDERLKKGNNHFVLEVTDQRDNKTVFEKNLVRD